MAAEGSMVQRSAACAVRHIHIAQQRHQRLSTAHCFVSRGYVQRCLPVLIPCVHVSRVLQQHLHCLLHSGHRQGNTHKLVLSAEGVVALCVESAGNISEGITSLHEATARCRGVNHLLSLAFTLAPVERQDHHSVEETQSKLVTVIFHQSKQ